MKITNRLLVLSALAMMGGTTPVEAGNAHSNKTGCFHPPELRTVSRIPIAVFAPADIQDSLVDRVFAEVEAIWKPTGITFDWHRITSTEAASGEHLDVSIEERKDGFLEHPAALGWIGFTADRPESYIHLSRGRAEALILDTWDLGDGTPFAHEVLLGRALGRALSHELGHYLLQSKAHTQRGLMRANWPSAQIFSINRRGFELSAEQSEVAARHAQEDAGSRSRASSNSAPGDAHAPRVPPL